jgi:hypothetical protein
MGPRLRDLLPRLNGTLQVTQERLTLLDHPAPGSPSGGFFIP